MMAVVIGESRCGTKKEDGEKNKQGFHKKPR
jgi:hypothetical protein